ncbi:GNAT family N-acetyltransferase [Dactylosporangium sp. NPDC049140]|uniref:GNAT family N-acetyltransferase n=1 Tax=Dactylosporangium sp. NPDC049140 TaxID=3155647 RepID=UPI0033C46C66
MPPLVGPALPDDVLSFPEQPRIVVDDTWMLRPWQEDDAAEVMEAFTDPDIQRWNMHRIDDDEEARGWVRAWNERWHRGTDAAWAVSSAHDGRAAGHIALRMIRLEHARAELSWWVRPSARGMNAASRATRALARWAFDEVGLQRLFLLHSVGNAASCRVAEHGGFRLEGTLRNFLQHTDGWHDMHMHARLRDDPD